jgi:hypothetical protein
LRNTCASARGEITPRNRGNKDDQKPREKPDRFHGETGWLHVRQLKRGKKGTRLAIIAHGNRDGAGINTRLKEWLKGMRADQRSRNY